MDDYHKFIQAKRKRASSYGFNVNPESLNSSLFHWQKMVCRWAIRRGRAALFEECGLGKTFQQLEWARCVVDRTSKPVVIHCPVGVRHQTLREAKRFSVACDVRICDSDDDVGPGINLVNYEKLHKIDTSRFAGVVLDESSILKGKDSKTRSALCDAWSHAEYRLACTATPAPNDHVELGNHAEFLGVCQSVDMLNRWFVHDSGDTSKWRLRKHAVTDFWAWVSSWAVCVSKPSDVGGDDTGFDLPPLKVQRHIVHADSDDVPAGMLFNTSGLSATTVHEEKRLTNSSRCRKAAELVNSSGGSWIVWCDTNYEADLLAELIPDAVEVRGSDSDKAKESKLSGFTDGEHRVIISKPTIAGFGMNWQHCRQMVFAGLSYSFEQYYQAVRRCYRFGQKETVDVHLVIADTETAIQSAVARKESDFAVMRSGMAAAMNDGSLQKTGGDIEKSRYGETRVVELPKWIGGRNEVRC